MLATLDFWARTGAVAAILVHAGTATADHRLANAPRGADAYRGAGIARAEPDRGADLSFAGAELDQTRFEHCLGCAFDAMLRMGLSDIDLGACQRAPGFPGSGFQPSGFSADAVTVGAEIGRRPADGIAFFARGGPARWQLVERGGGVTFEDEGEAPFAGPGVRFRLAPNLDITGARERYRVAELGVDAGSMAVTLRF